MQTCDKDHVDIAFEGWCNECPLCKLKREAQGEKFGLEGEIVLLENEVRALDEQIERYKKELEAKKP